MFKVSAQTRRGSECGVVVDMSGVLQVCVHTHLRKNAPAGKLVRLSSVPARLWSGTFILSLRFPDINWFVH